MGTLTIDKQSHDDNDFSCLFTLPPDAAPDAAPHPPPQIQVPTPTQTQLSRASRHDPVTTYSSSPPVTTCTVAFATEPTYPSASQPYTSGGHVHCQCVPCT